jgi:hypothetical protein
MTTSRARFDTVSVMAIGDEEDTVLREFTERDEEDDDDDEDEVDDEDDEDDNDDEDEEVEVALVFVLPNNEPTVDMGEADAIEFEGFEDDVVEVADVEEARVAFEPDFEIASCL